MLQDAQVSMTCECERLRFVLFHEKEECSRRRVRSSSQACTTQPARLAVPEPTKYSVSLYIETEHSIKFIINSTF